MRLPPIDTASAIPPWTVRAFATDPSDLAESINPSAPCVATDVLLLACLRDGDGRPPSIEDVRGWTLVYRLDGLVAVRQAGGIVSEQVAMKCPNSNCGARFEAELKLAACRQSRFDLVVEFESAGTTMRARIPTGNDQARWQRELPSLHAAAADLIVSDHAVPEPDDEMVSALNTTLGRADPLRELPLDLPCPECGATSRHVLDLEAHLLQSFERAQSAWLREIAALASAFHWPEADVAAMPKWRRAFYLGSIAADVA